jgi:hypothetical protein
MNVTVRALARHFKTLYSVPEEVSVEAETVGEAIDAWLKTLSDDAERQRFILNLGRSYRRCGIGLLHNKHPIRRLKRRSSLERKLKDGDVLWWIPQI